MDKNTVWITGAGGLIGSHVVRLAREYVPGWRIVPLTRADLDLSDLSRVRQRFEREMPGLLIHCAALSNSAECEARPSLARRVNFEVSALLAELSADARMVFFSTDLVFDGRKGNYVESDAVNPTNLYTETKVQAEAEALKHRRHVVIRTSINGGPSPSGKRGFDEALCEIWKAGKTPRLFTDEFRCPIAAAVTARAAWELALGQGSGVFHVAGSERLSRWQIGQLLAARHTELNPRCEAVSLTDYVGPPRPADCSLNCAKAQALLSFPLPRYSDWLAANSLVQDRSAC